MCLVENGDGSARASYGPVAGNLVDLQTFDWHGHTVGGHVEGGELVVLLLRRYFFSPAARYRRRSDMS